MGWIYLDDAFPEHPKVVAAGDAAAWMFVCGLGYTARHGNTGMVPKEMAGRLTGAKNAGTLARKLVDVGLWHDQGDRYEINDYAFWNSSQIERTNKAKKAAEARWRPHRDPSPSDAQALAEHDAQGTFEHHAQPADEQMLNGTSSTCPSDASRAPAPFSLPPPASPKNQDPVLVSTHDRANPNPDKRDQDSEKRGREPDRGADRLVAQLVAVCTGKKRDTVQDEAVQVVAWALGYVDRRVVEESIGYAALLDVAPVLPRAVAPLIERRAADYEIRIQPFRPPTKAVS